MDKLRREINSIIVKSLCMATPHVEHLIKSSQPDDNENQLCFQVLGFDIMIDKDFVPQLIEINQMPSFATDFPIDYKIKRGLIIDVMKKLCLNVPRKYKYKADLKAKF